MTLQSAVALNQAPAEPDLRSALDLVKKEIFLEFACQHVGKIQSFDALTQLATVSINYTRTYFEKNTFGVLAPKQVSYPLLIDVPVVGLRGGTASLTMPIKTGDDCLLLVNDRDIDVWFSGSSNSPVASNRLHSLTDAFALVGVRSRADILVGYDAARAVLRNGLSSRVAVASDGAHLEFTDPTGVTVKASVDATANFAQLLTLFGKVAVDAASTGKVTISTTAGGTLGAALQSLCTALSTMASSAGIAATNMATATAAMATGFTALGNPGGASGATALGAAATAQASAFSAAASSLSTAASTLGNILL